MSSDEAFFTEWTHRRPGTRRDLNRARALVTALHAGVRVPVLTVVGSKGKGTTATYASAYLASTGATVVTVTSPGLRSNRDRIRVNGASISDEDLASLGSRVTRETLPPSEGYLSPAGLFTIAGILHAQRIRADFVVLEAGMGGASDEVSLFPAQVVAVTEIFAEHIGVLGNTVAEIAREKAGVIADETLSVVSLPQTPEVWSELSTRAGARLHRIDPQEAPWTRNAILGRTAAAHLTDLRPDQKPLLPVRLPARFSHHDIGHTRLIIDSPISRAGVEMSVQRAVAEWGGIDHVLLCLPDHKDLDGAIEALNGLPVTFVRLPQTHLNFNGDLPNTWHVTTIDKVDAAFIENAGNRVLALGTVYFTGHLLDNLDIPTDRLFEYEPMRTAVYRFITTSWGVFVQLTARALPQADYVGDTIKITDRVSLALRSYTHYAEIAEQITPAVRSAATKIEESLDGDGIVIEVRKITYTETDYQPEGVRAAMDLWLSEEFGIDLPEMTVHFDKSQKQYVFHWPCDTD
ncbi:hypothetical protein [Herbidospora sp. RD11066]